MTDFDPYVPRVSDRCTACVRDDRELYASIPELRFYCKTCGRELKFAPDDPGWTSEPND